MAISGYLSEFSLPEILWLLEQGQKTGQLSIREISDYSSNGERNFYIWFRQGQLVAAADRLDGQGLLAMIHRRGWLSTRAAARITEVCAVNQPTGLCLKSQGILDAEQLKLLFRTQVLQQICNLFTIQEGQFEFNGKIELPNSEMTGLSAPAKEVTLAGLRTLQDWSVLRSKLPEPTSGLVNTVNHGGLLRLSQLEAQVWEFTKGTVSLEAIAQQLQIPTEKIQQVAFRLIVVGLAEEVPLMTETPMASFDMDPGCLIDQPVYLNSMGQLGNQDQDQVSHSFLQNLVSFLKGKV